MNREDFQTRVDEEDKYINEMIKQGEEITFDDKGIFINIAEPLSTPRDHDVWVRISVHGTSFNMYAGYGGGDDSVKWACEDATMETARLLRNFLNYALEEFEQPSNNC